MTHSFGMTSKGEEARLFTIQNGKGMEIKVSDYGAALVQVRFLTRKEDFWMWCWVMMRYKDMRREMHFSALR